MKILVVCQYFYPEQFRINDVCETLIKEGHQVTVLTGLPNYPKGKVFEDYRFFKKRKENINGIEVIRNFLIGRGKNKLTLMLNYISFAISASLKTIFLNKKFDVVFVYQLSPITMAIPAIIYKAFTKKKIVLYCNDLWPESLVSGGATTNGLLFKTIYKLSKWIYSKADKIAISSKMFANYFEDVLKLKKDFFYLPSYAEELFKSEENYNFNSDEFNLVFAGNIGEMQSVETIIKAANELKENKSIKFHIVGDGSKLIDCKSLANDFYLDETVTFYGYKPLNEMPTFYKMADAFLVTLSKNKFISYTLPNKVQSYLATGKPIIGAIDGETSLVINEANCGVCVAAEDYNNLANEILKFCDNKENIAVSAKNAKDYYQNNFNKSIFIDRLVSLLLNECG